ncbi:FAD/NAD(P)-binding oxidoreductase [Gammaproteobacteria bacterium]|nr:FAD/NAD(P)-binding oxidoreductase [Gammaproteobacteria bacterium]
MNKANSKIHSQDSQADVWDVTIIGGGVVGCAVMRRLVLNGLKVLLLEKGDDILSGASKANSALLHTGFDAPPNSLELACIQKGYQEFMEIHQKLNLPILKTGALVIAWNEDQYQNLPDIVEKAHKNNVLDVKMIVPEVLYQREKNLNKGALGAVEVPNEAIIDPWSSPLAYLTQALLEGGLKAQYHFNCEVLGGDLKNNIWNLQTARGNFKSKLVINCAGLMGDLIESIAHPSPFMIKPRKGQFLILDKAAASLVDAIILPVPTAITKGVLICKTIFGNLLLGPTAQEQEDRIHASVDQESLEDLLKQGRALIPKLEQFSVSASYAGLRPATQFKEYQIKAYQDQQWICVGGIRSTGLSSALGIAHYVQDLCKQHFDGLLVLGDKEHDSLIIHPQMPNLAEHLPRDYHTAGHGGIVCHCENVTLREIKAALASSVPPQSINALRRRTRAMMGRCNGFYCSHKVTQLLDNHLDLSNVAENITKNISEKN